MDTLTNNTLSNKKVAILATDGFEESELTSPRDALHEAGAITHIISLEKGTIRSWKDGDWGTEVTVDKTLDEVQASDYNALVLPGGVINPDKLRVDENAIGFIRNFGRTGKPIAAICHGPWTLIDAGIADGKRLASWKSIRRDLENAGATWVDEEVVVDRGVVTSRSPDDLAAFNAKMIEEIAEGRHQRRAA